MQLQQLNKAFLGVREMVDREHWQTALIPLRRLLADYSCDELIAVSVCMPFRQANATIHCRRNGVVTIFSREKRLLRFQIGDFEVLVRSPVAEVGPDRSFGIAEICAWRQHAHGYVFRLDEKRESGRCAAAACVTRS